MGTPNSPRSLAKTRSTSLGFDSSSGPNGTPPREPKPYTKSIWPPQQSYDKYSQFATPFRPNSRTRELTSSDLGDLPINAGKRNPTPTNGDVTSRQTAPSGSSDGQGTLGVAKKPAN